MLCFQSFRKVYAGEQVRFPASTCVYACKGMLPALACLLGNLRAEASPRVQVLHSSKAYLNPNCFNPVPFGCKLSTCCLLAALLLSAGHAQQQGVPQAQRAAGHDGSLHSAQHHAEVGASTRPLGQQTPTVQAHACAALAAVAAAAAAARWHAQPAGQAGPLASPPARHQFAHPQCHLHDQVAPDLEVVFGPNGPKSSSD